MPRTINKLSAMAVSKAKGEPGKARFLHDGNGLYLRIGPTGSKSWVLRYQKHGRVHDMGIGSASVVGVAQARERIKAPRQQLLDGTDPIAARKAQRIDTSTTFQQCAEALIRSKTASWKPGRGKNQWARSLERYAYPILGDLPVAAIDTGLVSRVLEQDTAAGTLWATKPETAGRVRGRIEAVLDWAKTRGYRVGENPAAWKGHLENVLPRIARVATIVRAAAGRPEHHEALPYAELPGFLIKLRQRSGGVARALEFVILTAARTSEVLRAEWSEFDLAERVWTIPAERMKAGKEHRVPLSDAALAILGQRADYTRPFPYQITAMLNLIRRRMHHAKITTHGFRSTFADWATEQTTFPAEVREMALAHNVGNKVEQAYRRSDLFAKRRELAEAWARFCTGAEGQADIAKVQEWLGHANVATTRIYDHRKTRPEDSPTFKVTY